jgi:hypothetical protein
MITQYLEIVTAYTGLSIAEIIGFIAIGLLVLLIGKGK